MDYEQAQRRVDQLRRELNMAADRLRNLAEQVENLGAELPVILEDAPEESTAGSCEGCNYHTRDGRCLYMIGCVRKD